MRSSTIFLVFGIIVTALLVFTILSRMSMDNEPAMRTANDFLRSARTHDLKTLNRVIDPEYVTITQAGGKLGGVHFKEVSDVGGAFSRRPERKLSYVELLSLKIKPKSDPVVVDSIGLAAVKLEDVDTGGGRIYMHRIHGAWKIFYVSDSLDELE